MPCPEIAIHKKHPYAKYIETREADFLSFSPNGSASGETKIVKVANAIDKAVDGLDATKVIVGDKKEKPEYIYLHKDDQNPNNNVQVLKEVNQTQQKKKDEN